MHHINIKLFVADANGIKVSDAIPVFHRWIQERKLTGLLIDVADYSHVPAGPGVMLIGHDANYSLDLTRNRLGLLYSRKTTTNASPLEQLSLAHESAGRACRLLESEPEFQNKLRFNEDEIELTLNDRLLYPNRGETLQALEPAIRAFVDHLGGGNSYTLKRAEDPRERFRINIVRNLPGH